MKYKCHSGYLFTDSAVLNDKRPVSEMSDIDVMDEVIEGEGHKESRSEETKNPQEDEWHEVSKVLW